MNNTYPFWHDSEPESCEACKAVVPEMEWSGGFPTEVLTSEVCPECDAVLTHQWTGPTRQTEFYSQDTGGWCPEHGNVMNDYEWS